MFSRKDEYNLKIGVRLREAPEYLREAAGF